MPNHLNLEKFLLEYLIEWSKKTVDMSKEHQHIEDYINSLKLNKDVSNDLKFLLSGYEIIIGNYEKEKLEFDSLIENSKLDLVYKIGANHLLQSNFINIQKWILDLKIGKVNGNLNQVQSYSNELENLILSIDNYLEYEILSEQLKKSESNLIKYYQIMI